MRGDRRAALDPRLWTIQLYRLHASFLPCLCLDWLSSQHYLKLILLFFSPEKEFKYIYGHLQTTNRTRTRTGLDSKDRTGHARTITTEKSFYPKLPNTRTTMPRNTAASKSAAGPSNSSEDEIITVLTP